MKKTTVWNMKTIVLLLGILVLLTTMFLTFMDVKDDEFKHAKGNVIWIERKLSSQHILEDMKRDEQALKAILKKEKCKGELYALFDPNLLIYQSYKSNRVSPYTIAIVENAYLQRLGVTHPKKGELYRYKGEAAGKLELQVVNNEKQKTSELTKDDLTAYPMEGKAVLADVLSFMPMDSGMTKFDYMNKESFEALLQAVFQQNSAAFSFSKNASYRFYLYSDTTENAQYAEKCISKKGYTTILSDGGLNEHTFAVSDTLLRICGFGLLILVPLEVFLLIANKRKQQ